MKKFLSLSMAVVLSLSAIVPTSLQAASKQVKLNTKSTTVIIGKTKKVKLLNNKKTVKWSVSNKKLKLVKKTKTYATVKGVSEGTSNLIAKVGKKSYKCKITVKKTVTVTPKPTDTAIPTETPPTETPPTATPSTSYVSDFTIENKDIYSGNDVCISVNNTTKTSDDVQIEFLVQNNSTKNYSISAHSYAINELMAGSHLYGSDVNVPSEKKAKFSITIEKEWFVKNKINDVKKIDVVFWGYYDSVKEWDSGNVEIKSNLDDSTGYYSNTNQELYSDDNVSVWYLYNNDNEYTFSIKNKTDRNTSYTIENCSVNDWSYDLGSCKYDLYSEPIHINTNDTFTIVVDKEFIESNSISTVENLEFTIKLSKNKYPFSVSTNKILLNLK